MGQIPILAKILEVDKDDLLSLWLADKVCNVVKNENVALKAMQVAEEEIKFETIKKLK